MRVLICTNSPAQIGEVRRLCEAATETGRIRFMDTAGDDFVGHEPKKATPDSVSRPSAKQRLVALPFVRFLRLISAGIVQRLSARRLLKRIQPDVVAVFSNRALNGDMSILEAAGRAKIPRVLLPYAEWGDEVSAWSRRREPAYSLDRGPGRWFRRLVGGLFPNHVLTFDGERLLFYPGAETLALGLIGFGRTEPWILGKSLIDRRTVMGEKGMEQLVALGVPRETIVITGQPSTDALFRGVQRAGEIRAALNDQYGLDPCKPLIVCAVPQNAEHGLRTWAEHADDIEALTNVLRDSGAEAVLSLHPKSDRHYYQCYAERSGCHIADATLAAILPAADVFLATYSSTVTWAASLGIATSIMDFAKVSYNLYDDIPSIAKHTNINSFSLDVYRLCKDQKYRAEKAARAKMESERHRKINGQSCVKTLALLEFLVSRRNADDVRGTF